VLIEAAFDAVAQSVAVGAAQYGGKAPHDLWVGVDRREGRNVGTLPAAQKKSTRWSLQPDDGGE
jgi:hypothetical protein